MAFKFRLTNKGRAAMTDEANSGTNAIQFTKLALGDMYGVGGAGNDGRTALRNQKDSESLTGTAEIDGRIGVRADFDPDEAYAVTEVGLYGKIGDDGTEELYAYWTDNGAKLATTVADSTLIVVAVLEIQSAAADVTVTVDASVSLGDPEIAADLVALTARVATAESEIDAIETHPAIYEDPEFLFVR